MGTRWNTLAIVLFTMAVVSEVAAFDFDSDNDGDVQSYLDNNADLMEEPIQSDAEEYIRHINSMINAYRGNIKGRLIIETNSLINTKYRTWKRNADLINSILALPKGMNDAGR